MTVQSAARLGPVDYLVLEFAGDVPEVPGDVAAELASLIENGIVRVLDMLIARKELGGRVEVTRVGGGDGGDVRELEDVRTHVVDVLTFDEVSYLMAPIASEGWAVVVVCEHRWAVPLLARTRRAGGQLVASGTVPTDPIAARLFATDAAATDSSATDSSTTDSSTTDDAHSIAGRDDDKAESAASEESVP